MISVVVALETALECVICNYAVISFGMGSIRLCFDRFNWRLNIREWIIMCVFRFSWLIGKRNYF